MDKEVTLMTKPEELIAWLDENDLLMGFEMEDADILLGYMEGHGYGIGTDEEGKLVRQDLCEEDGEIEEYSIDDLIDTVCEWNYEMILAMDNDRRNPDNFIDFSNKQSRYESLKSDEERLDKLFDKTIYGKEIEKLAVRLADDVIQGIQIGKEGASIEKICEEIKEYQTDKKGKAR